MDKKNKTRDLSKLFKLGVGNCPSTEDLVSFAVGETENSDINHHIKHCSICKREYETIKEEISINENEHLYSLVIEKIKEFIKNREYSNAEEYIENILKPKPENAIYNYLLSYVYSEQGNLTKADEFYKIAIKNNPNIEIELSVLSKFVLNIEDTAIQIFQYYNVIKNQINIFISEIKRGPGELKYYIDGIGVTRGAFEKRYYESEGFQKNTKLILHDLSVDILIDDDKLIIQSDDDVEIELTNENGKEIKGQKISNKRIYNLKN